MKIDNSYTYSKWKKKNKPLFRMLIFVSIGLIFLSGVGILGYKGYKEYLAFNEKVDVSNDPAFRNPTQVKIDNNKLEVPSAKVLNVAYTVQAPLTNWNVHEESCEEAAVLMYHYFLEGQTTFDGKSVITPQLANDEEIKMKQWEVKAWGKEPDLTIEALGKFAQEYYGYNYEVLSNVTKEDIEKQVALGHPVIVPVMTQALHNPHYSPGNVYHVVLVKGYKPEGVVTNDAGVKEGENYFYTWDTIFSAMDAQTPKMNQGRVMAVLTK